MAPTFPSESPAENGPGPQSETQAAEQAEAERTQLLAAAREVLQRSGWWGFKVESVLRQAGLSTRSFYRHFEKKNDLLLAILEYQLGVAADRLRQAAAGAQTPSEQIHAWVVAAIRLAYEQDLAQSATMFAVQLRRLQSEYSEAVERCADLMRAPLVDAINDGLASGQFQSEDPVADAKVIYRLVMGMTADQAALRCPITSEEIERIVMPFISRAIERR